MKYFDMKGNVSSLPRMLVMRLSYTVWVAEIK